MDKWVWQYDKRGEFSVRSAYKVEMDSRKVGSQSGHGGERVWWKKLRGAQAPNKMKIHVWRGFFEALPARCQLSQRGVKVSNLSPVCLCGLEDTTHTLWSCQESIEVWHCTSLWTILKSLPGGPFNALCMFLAAKGSLTHDLNIFCTIAWCL